MKVLHTVRDVLMRAIALAAIVLFAFMTVVGTWQIVSRYVFNSPSTVSEELLTYSFAWLSLVATTYVFGKRDHMRMAFLADRVGRNAGRYLQALAELLSLAFAAVVMVYGGIEITKLTMTQVTASLQVPMGYVYAILPASGMLIVYFSFVNLLDTLGGRKEG